MRIDLRFSPLFAFALATNSAWAADDSPSASAPAAPASTTESPDTSTSETPEARAARFAIAKEHFAKARALRESNDIPAALAEFLAARESYPTWSATSSAAVCLQLLHRYDEALDMFEVLLRDYEQIMPKDAKLAAQKALVDMNRLVGAVDIVDSELDAAITIDGRYRGTYPSPNPFRVPAGSHVVRVYMEGHEPFETSVDIAGKQVLTISARLRKLTLDNSGRLRVTEMSNRALDVLIDGNIVGKTPWEGALRDGEHTVVLQGSDEWGTQPATVFVKRGKTESLGLAAERLEATLRIKPKPAGATVAIDGIPVGRGVWQGKLRQGNHKIEIAADGFVLFVKEKSLDKGADETIDITLSRDPSSPLWKDNRGRMFIEQVAAFNIVPSFGGDIVGTCGDSCSQWFGVGTRTRFRAGYQMPGGFLVGLDIGYLYARQKITDRKASIIPVGFTNEQGLVNDTLSLRGFMLGASVGIRVGKKELPISVNMGVGALLGATFRDRRVGTFTTNPRMNGSETVPAQTYEVDVTQTPAMWSIYAKPELQVAFPLRERLHLTVGIAAIWLITPDPGLPKWVPNGSKINAATSGQATFPEDKLLDSMLFLVTPEASIRYEF